jgi:hypothetical protein
MHGKVDITPQKFNVVVEIEETYVPKNSTNSSSKKSVDVWWCGTRLFSFLVRIDRL